MGKGISREIIRYVVILIVLTLFLGIIFIYFNKEITAAGEKLMNVLKIKVET
ncbi:MAG: hypothetical protein J7J93_02375 [Candidatus Aenigmarchaeota archaeon]|nr:hypothetical protein [Candidatus Aenigmarchaeota archaeon]